MLLIDRIDLRSYDAHISGVVLYLAFQVFRANPAAVLIVTGGEILNVWLYNRLRRIDRLNVLHVFNTHEEAEAFLEAHRTDQDLML